VTAGSRRRRLDRDRALAVLATLEASAPGAVLRTRLGALSAVVAGQPDGATAFPLLAAARAVGPGAAEPVAAFREFRRAVARLATAQGIDVVLVVDTQRRSPEGRWLWMEEPDPTERHLAALSRANTSAAPGKVVAAAGRQERDGRAVVRIFFDIAPGDRSRAGRAMECLLIRLRTDVDYDFERLADEPELGHDPQGWRARRLREADLVVVFLSPQYLARERDELGGAGSAFRVARSRVIPVELVALTQGRSALGPYAGLQRFVPQASREADASGTPAPGLGALRSVALERAVGELHVELARVVAAPWRHPMELLADALARVSDVALDRYIPNRWIHVGLDADDADEPERAQATSAPPTGRVEHVVERMLEWARAPGPPYLVLLGEYGMGKTVSSQTFARRLLDQRRDDPSLPLPIYFDLRKLATGLRRSDPTLGAILDDLIVRSWETGQLVPAVTATDVVTAVQDRGAIVVFDGLDEVLVHMEESQGQAFLRELLRVLPPGLAGDHGQAGTGKLVVTCRTHYFRTKLAERAFFLAEGRDGVRARHYEALHLLPFDERQVLAYVTRRQGAGGVDRAVELIRSVHDLAGLARRPVNLAFICDNLARLERRVADGRPIDAAALYDELVQSWLARDAGKHQLSPPHKLTLMEDLAATLWRAGTRRMGVDELERWLRARLTEEPDLRNWAKLAGTSPDVLAEDLRTATFLVRPGSHEFEFAHTSLLEYLLARYLHRAMGAGDTGR